MLHKISAYAVVRAWKIKEAVKNFWEEERGDHLIEIILVLVIVLGIAVFFRKQIQEIVQNLWNDITNSTNDFRNNNEIGR